MLKPINMSRTVEYVFPDDTTEPATVWRLRALTKRERRDVLDDGSRGRLGPSGVEVSQRAGSLNWGFVKRGLAGVEHFPGWADEAGSAGRRYPTDAFLDTIPDDYFDRLSGQIALLSSVTEDDAGKSSPPST